ncbi:hypothetical protein B0J13DRAFT_674960 [Dactylonectria estremocensis]|uniref:Rhodopsin domain-containing protein n=1 Tax=Dactylonectria estremocensis TaxID=1079267 RepID=A0A9P9EWM1_9HYPO|nr:hypothetical protein B0J13DRAFT_674960 [Dactylonectria estremocensis]
MPPSGLAVIATEALLHFLTASLIAGRFYLRLHILQLKLALTDLILSLAWLATVANSSVDVALFTLGALDAKVTVSLEGFNGDAASVDIALKIYWASTFPYFIGFYLSKAAILLFFFQIFPTVLRAPKILLWSITGYCIAAFAVSLSLALFICLPIERNWSLGPSSCNLRITIVLFSVAWALHFSSDIFIFAVPFLILRGLRMSKVEKIGVYLTFGLGIVNISFSLVRFIMIESAYVKNMVPNLSITSGELWSALDVNVCLLIACLPGLRAYLRLTQLTSILPSYLSDSASHTPDLAPDSGPGPRADSCTTDSCTTDSVPVASLAADIAENDSDHEMLPR